MIGAIELGGTKIVCGIGTDAQNISQVTRFPTSNPDQCLLDIHSFFKEFQLKHGKLSCLGIASFGPIEIDPLSENYGEFLKTPKPGWSHFPLRDHLVNALSIPVYVTTDVNGALLAEVEYGAARGNNNAVYVTVGTGVGGGIISNGQLVNGFLHPEIGHMRIPTNGLDGSCPFHGNCLEGLASGAAITKRAGKQAHLLSSDDPIWNEVALSLADMCINLITILSTEVIILGGGIMKVDGLLTRVRSLTEQRLANYLPINKQVGGIEKLIISPELNDQSGLMGAFLVAQPNDIKV